MWVWIDWLVCDQLLQLALMAVMISTSAKAQNLWLPIDDDCFSETGCGAADTRKCG